MSRANKSLLTARIDTLEDKLNSILSKVTALDERLTQLVDVQSRREANSNSFRKEFSGVCEELWRQSEALLSVYRVIDGLNTVPRTRGWAASPDFLLLLAESIVGRQPKNILECGCGTSTIVMGYLAKKYGGQVVAFENRAESRDQVRAMLLTNGLDQNVRIVDCPLKKYRYEGYEHDFNWYDLAPVSLPSRVDMIVVDGPFGGLNPYARFPAGPELINYLAPGGVVFLDDTNRKDEGDLPSLWRRSYPALTGVQHKTEKGAIELILK